MKTRGFFLLLLLFTGACFAWWIIQLDRLNRNNMAKQEEILYLQVERVQNQLIWQAVKDSCTEFPLSLRIGSLVVFLSQENWKSIQQNYPQLQFSWAGGYLLIEPKAETLIAIREKSSSIQKQQIIESSVFFSLLFIGFIWIYRGLVQAIDLSLQQSNFLVSITHELKTPIATTRLLFETISKYAGESQKIVELSKAGMEGNKHQLDLVESLLVASRLENRSLAFPLRKTNLSIWLGDELQILQRDYQYGLNLEVNIQPGIDAYIEDMSLRLSLANLISNARKYAGPEKLISVSLSKEKGMACIKICDEGPGIPDADKKRIFKKFFRCGDAYTQIHHGTGLGLFIVAETIKRHKGKVWVQDRLPFGSSFNLTIKLS